MVWSVELFERAIRNGSHVGDLVCDEFGGSGTTVVACERTARGARVLEQDPGYCAVILQRLADMGLVVPNSAMASQITINLGARNQR